MSPVDPIPHGYPAVCPYLTVADVPQFMDFLEHVFGARLIMKMEAPGGAIMHAEMRIGDAPIMMGQAGGEWPPTPGANYVYVVDVDAAYQRALDKGASSIMPPTDMFYGDRQGGVKDALGNIWYIATHIEDVSPEEMHRRAEEVMSQQAQDG